MFHQIGTELWPARRAADKGDIDEGILTVSLQSELEPGKGIGEPHMTHSRNFVASFPTTVFPVLIAFFSCRTFV